jgi:hypothetical protein
MRLHKVIDALMNCDRKQFINVPDKTYYELADVLIDAEPFVFENVPMEELPDSAIIDGERGYGVPIPTDEERGWIANGLVPFPAPICWYEYPVFGIPTALVVDSRRKEQILFHRFIFLNGRLNPIGMWGVWNPRRKPVLTDLPEAQQLRPRDLSHQSAFAIILTDQSIVQWFEKNRAFMTSQYADAPSQMLFLTLMINSRTTEIRTVRPAEKLVRAQLKRGATPLPEHRVVNLVPRRFVDKTNGGAPGKSGWHPRIHWRRSHTRHLDHKTPGSQWAEGIEHKGKKGWWVVPIPRFLVGRRTESDVEEVTHEYRVTGGEPAGQLGALN